MIKNKYFVIHFSTDFVSKTILFIGFYGINCIVLKQKSLEYAFIYCNQGL